MWTQIGFMAMLTVGSEEGARVIGFSLGTGEVARFLASHGSGRVLAFSES